VSTPSPGPWIDHERREETPWKSQQGIVKLLEFPVRIQAMSRRAFHLYWQRHHSPHVMNATAFSQFIRKYMTAHVYGEHIEGIPGHLRPVTYFEGAGEIWLDNVETVTDWLGHPLYSELIAPDEPRFIDATGSIEVLLVKDQRLHDPTPDLAETGLTKLYLLVQRNVGLDDDGFHSAVAEHVRLMLSKRPLRGLLRRAAVSHRLCDPYPDWLPATQVDAVIELWFDSPAGLQAFFAEPVYAGVIQPREAALFDTTAMRIVITRLHVVHDEFSFQPTTMQPLPFRWER
jgi:hypothetical protein